MQSPPSWGSQHPLDCTALSQVRYKRVACSPPAVLGVQEEPTHWGWDPFCMERSWRHVCALECVRLWVTICPWGSRVKGAPLVSSLGEKFPQEQRFSSSLPPCSLSAAVPESTSEAAPLRLQNLAAGEEFTRRVADPTVQSGPRTRQGGISQDVPISLTPQAGRCRRPARARSLRSRRRARGAPSCFTCPRASPAACSRRARRAGLGAREAPAARVFPRTSGWRSRSVLPRPTRPGRPSAGCWNAALGSFQPCQSVFRSLSSARGRHLFLRSRGTRPRKLVRRVLTRN